MKLFGALVSLLFCTVCLLCCKPDPVKPPAFTSKAYTDSITNIKFASITNFKSGLRPICVGLQDGRRLWLFSDVNIYDNSATGYMQCTPTANNCAIVESNGSFNLLNTSATDFISSPLVSALKPVSAYQFLDTIFCFCRSAAATANNYVHYVAKIAYPSLQFLKVDTISMKDSVDYGMSVTVHPTYGFVYAYGIRQPAKATNALFVARYSLLTPHSPWYFYNNAGQWTTDGKARTAITTVDNENFSVVQYRGDYMMLRQSAGGTCNGGLQIRGNYGINEYGMWQNERVLFNISRAIQQFQPNAQHIQIHLADINPAGEVLCSYSIVDYLPCIQTCNNGIMQQKDRGAVFIRIPLKHIYEAW